MECILCHKKMCFQLRKFKIRSGEVEEEQYICPKCFASVVIRNGLCTWYDENNLPIHSTHDQ